MRNEGYSSCHVCLCVCVSVCYPYSSKPSNKVSYLQRLELYITKVYINVPFKSYGMI